MGSWHSHCMSAKLWSVNNVEFKDPMKLQPLADRIVARQLEAEAKTASGILLPDSAKEKPMMAEVLAVGTEVKEVKTGDKIVYKQYSATEFKLGSDEQFVIKEEDVLAVVKG